MAMCCVFANDGYLLKVIPIDNIFRTSQIIIITLIVVELTFQFTLRVLENCIIVIKDLFLSLPLIAN